MATIEEQCFLRAVPNTELLLKFGFTLKKKIYHFETKFCDDLFLAQIDLKLESKGKYTIKGKVFDLDNDEEYLPIRNSNVVGAFVNKVKNEYIALLTKIREQCFVMNYFVNQQANEITQYIQANKKTKIDFPWIKYPDNGIFKNTYGKWFAAILPVDYSKLDPNKSGKIEIILLKANPKDIPLLIQKKGFYAGYHMNKKNWISIALDGSVNIDTIQRFVEQSYNLVGKYKPSNYNDQPLNLSNNHWIVLCNPHYYNVDQAFKEHDQIIWKQTTKIKPGDYAYIYVGAPFSCIKYKCIVDEVDLPYEHQDPNVKIKKVMKITKVRQYRNRAISHATLAKFGIKMLVGPRRLSKELIDFIEEHFEQNS